MSDNIDILALEMCTKLQAVKELQSQINEVTWNVRKEGTLKIWGEKAHGSYLLHMEESSLWETFSNRMHVAILVMSAVTGVISISDTSFSGLRYLFSVLTLSMGGLTSLVKYYKPDEKAVVHKNISQKYNKMYRNVLVELNQPRRERTHADEFTLKIKKANEDIQNEAPLVSSRSVKHFLAHVQLDTSSFPDAVSQNTQPIPVLVDV